MGGLSAVFVVQYQQGLLSIPRPPPHSMSSSSLNDEILRTLGNEFSDRARRGERPTVEEYAGRYSGSDAKRVADFLNSKKKTRPAAATAVTKSDAAPPKQFGRYQIERTLGEGGMGAVYLAHDSQLDRKVALKTPKFSSNSDPTVMQRFYREARSAATLQHPNICPVYDVGEIDGIHYISMAYIEGRPLSDLVSSNKQPPISSLLKVVRKIAIALHEAHLQGLIHRDLKPANIMIDRRNEPIVMDFGLARQFGDEDSNVPSGPAISADALAAATNATARITMPGTVMGSPGYMAPEQLQGDHSQIGPASDVYAMGVLMFELLTGQLPFPGTGTLMSVVNAVMSEPPPDATAIRSTLDPRVAAVCRKAMSKRVDERYESMQAFALAISRLLKSETEGDRSAARTSQNVSPELVRTKEQFELARSLYQEGQFAGAVSIMEKMVASDQSPNQHLNQYAKWAQETLPTARSKAEDTALMGFADNGPLTDDLWGPATEAALPPKRRRTNARRKKKAKSFAYTFLAGAAGAIAVLVAAMTIQNALQSQARTGDSTPAADGSVLAPVTNQPAASLLSPLESKIADVAEADGNEPNVDESTVSPPRPSGPRPGRRTAFLDRLIELDQNQDKQLSKQEIESAPASRGNILRKLLERFEEFDEDKDGFLRRAELDRVIREMGREFEDRQRRGTDETQL